MKQETKRILLIEDNPAEALLIKELLLENYERNLFTIEQCSNLHEGLNCFKEKNFNVILLDLALPDSNGIETIISAIKEVKNIPIIVLTVTNTEETAVQAIKLGAQDYITKANINGRELERAINYAIERKLLENQIRDSKKESQEAYDHIRLLNDVFNHDIKNILQVVLSSMTLLSSFTTTSEKEQYFLEMVKIIKDQVYTGSNLISNVKILSSLRDIGISVMPIEISRALENAVKLVKKNYGYHDLNLKITNLEGVHYVHANDYLINIFYIIITNSIIHSRNTHKDIIINMSLEKIEGINYIKLEFSDNGIGIPDSMKLKIFERKTPDNTGITGMGLGLSLVKRFIDIYKGKIFVEDKVLGDYTNGSKFVVLLPKVN